MTDAAAPAPNNRPHLPALDGLRAFASLFVFNVHAFGYCLVAFHGWSSTETQPFPDDVFAAILLWLHRSLYGVDLFFVLSGFLMARQFDLAASRPGTFLTRRALRVVPAYVLALVIAGIARFAVDGTQFSPQDWVLNLAFLHGFLDLGIALINPVTWSMSYEVAFYLSVPLLALAFARSGRDVLVHLLVAAALLALIFALGTPLAGLHGYGLLFLVGIAIARAPLDRLLTRPVIGAAALAWLTFELLSKFVLIVNRELPYYLASMAGSGGLLLLALAWGRRDPNSPGRVLQWIGDRSYSLFLLHSVVVYVLGALLIDTLKPLGPVVASLVFIPFALGVSLLVSDLTYRVAERPYFRVRQQSK